MLIVGDTSRNPLTADLVSRGLIKTREVSTQGYEILNTAFEGTRAVVVRGGSLTGEIYGLYDIMDGISISNRIDHPDSRREPDLKMRYTRIPVRCKRDVQRAFRYRLNMVFGENPLNLLPWGSDDLRERNRMLREETRDLARYAHSLHMKFLAMGTEFTYHPDLLDEFKASLDPSDPGLWEAFRAKFRRLLEAVPELDGVCTFTGEEQRYWDPFRTFDLVHGGAECGWSLERRFRTYVKALWDVVVGEFDKLLVVRTWNTNSYEQHSQPEVYAGIFNEDVPRRNLYLVPSFTQNDRWWFQAYNPTFNLTSHSMMTVFETMDYHDGGQFFPTFPGFYFQAGLEHIMGGGEGNLEGASLDLPREEGWDTRNLTAYTVTRLMWDHTEEPSRIAEDFCAVKFGKEVAQELAEILLLSPVAYKYGLYIEPVTRGSFSSLTHIRTGGFIVDGYPKIDNGRAHLEFLRGIYLRCKPWMAENMMYLDHGLDTAKMMEAKFDEIESRVENGEEVERSLRYMRLLIEVNNLYVRTFTSYFEYMENPTEEIKGSLAKLHEGLRANLRCFMNCPCFEFRTHGVDRLLASVEDALMDRDAARRKLARSPTTAEIEERVLEQQKCHREIIHDQGDGLVDLVKVMYWEGRVDGRDILSIQEDNLSVEHLRWDHISHESSEFFSPLPKREGSVIIEDIESQYMHPFVIQQPTRDNDFTARIYLNDVPGGAHWCRFNLYFISRRPEKLGLDFWEE